MYPWFYLIISKKKKHVNLLSVTIQASFQYYNIPNILSPNYNHHQRSPTVPHHNTEHSTQCTYLVTLRNVRTNIFALETHSVFCFLCYQACNEHAQHSPCALSASTVFLHIISWTAWFKKVIEHEICVLIFPATFAWNISQSNKNSGRYDVYSSLCNECEILDRI